MRKTISLALISALMLGGCSTFSKSNRQRRAYAKYVRKASMTRARQQMHFRNSKPRMPSTPTTPSEPVENIETGPQSLSSHEG